MELLFDENEIQSNEAMRFMNKGGQKKKVKKNKKCIQLLNYRILDLRLKEQI